MIPLRDNIPSATRPVIVLLLIAACTAVFLHTIALPSAEALGRFVGAYALVPAQVTGRAAAAGGAPVPERFVTNLFLHGGWLHLIGNMLFLWIFADNVEDAMGHGRFAVFYLVCGVAANLAQVAADPRSTVPTIGASGAIAGVLGAYLILYPHARVLCLIPLWIFIQFIWVPALLLLPLWVVMQFVSGIASIGVETTGGVAWWAHVGGFFTGVALVRVFARA